MSAASRTGEAATTAQTTAPAATPSTAATVASSAAAAARWVATRGGRTYAVATVLGTVILVAAPFLGLTATWQRQIVLIAFLSLLVSGLNLTFGYAGELALGQVAVYAVGAYVAGYVSVHLTSDLLVALVAGALVGPVVGMITGIPGLRLGGWAFAMVGFFLVLSLPDLVDILSRYTGGNVGLVGIAPATLFGQTLDARSFYVVVVVIASLWFVVMRNLVTSWHGRALLVLRDSPVLAASLGLSVFRLKLRAYVIGAVPAGIAGALFANLDRYLAPQYFSFSLAVGVLAACVLGGRTSVFGAVVGAALLDLGPLRTGAFQSYATIIYGAFLLAGGVLLSGGVVGLLRAGVRRLAAVDAPAATADRQAGAGDADGPVHRLAGRTLEVDAVGKTFGGAVALDGVSLVARPGAITSVIGPNGSGKTTLLNLVNGFHRATSGRVVVGGEELHTLPTHRVARLGIARTFQTPIMTPGLTVREVVATSASAVSRSGLLAAVLRLPRYHRTLRADLAAADHALELVGLTAQAGARCDALSLGTRRLVEIARAIAAGPAVVLLDEVASGLDEDAVALLAGVIDRLRRAGATVVLVEHNFRLVLEVSDHVVVLAGGKVIAAGAPAYIAEHPDVIEQYLGTSVTPEDAVDA